MIKFGQMRKPLMISCLATSIALHCGAIWVLYSHPYTFEHEGTAALMKSAPTPSILTKDNAELLVEKMEKALEESLNTVVAVSHLSKTSENIAEQKSIKKESLETSPSLSKELAPVHSLPKACKENPSVAEPDPKEFAASMPTLFDPEYEADLADFALELEIEETPSSFQAEGASSADIADFALADESSSVARNLEDDYTMTSEQFSPMTLPSTQMEDLSSHLTHSLKSLKTSIAEELTERPLFTPLQESSTPQLILPNSVDYLRSQWIKRSMTEITLPDLDYYGLDKVADNLSWQEDLDVEVAFMPDPNSNKYIFSLTIHPEFDTECETMGQNFYFVIDRSSSVEKHKLSRFKLAIQRSLAALCEGDSFNIYFYDKHVVKLSENNLAVSPKTIQMAEDFLDQEPARSQYGKAEPFRSIESLLPEYFNPDQLHSVILLTDGNSLDNAQRQKKRMQYWMDRGDRNVSFYAAAAGRGNNLVLLDLISYATAGKMVYSDTNSGFPRKMVHLVKNLHNPIVKNLTVEVSPSASNAQVELHPRNEYLPPMFAGQPYVITGTVDELCDLTLFIQGKNQDRFINIRKRISLKEASSGGRSLEKLWANTQSKICYENFLESGKNIYLKEAEQIVAPYHGDIASKQ